MHPVLKECPTCGSRKIKVVHSDFATRMHGRSLSVPRLERQECPDCGEVIFDFDAMGKLEAARASARSSKSRAVR